IQAVSLQPRPRLAVEDGALLARLERRPDHAKGSSVPGGCQPARVAMSEDPPAIGDQRRAVASDRLASGEVLREQPVRLGLQRLERARLDSRETLDRPA